MPHTPQRPASPAEAIEANPLADATGLNSIRVDADAIDDLDSLAASLNRPAQPARTPIILDARRPSRNGVRATLIPVLFTGGAICEALAAAWFATDIDSPYRRVSIALPIVLVAAGAVLVAAAVINMLLSRQP